MATDSLGHGDDCTSMARITNVATKVLLVRLQESSISTSQGFKHSLRNRLGVDISRIEPITQPADALHDVVELHCLLLPIPLDDEHIHDGNKAGVRKLKPR